MWDAIVRLVQVQGKQLLYCGVQRCSRNAQLRRNGIPEMLLLVAQRISKYPLLIEPILLSTRGMLNLHRCRTCKHWNKNIVLLYCCPFTKNRYNRTVGDRKIVDLKKLASYFTVSYNDNNKTYMDFEATALANQSRWGNMLALMFLCSCRVKRQNPTESSWHGPWY